jgi:hypothetical protein
MAVREVWERFRACPLLDVSKQWPHLADGTGDGGAVHIEPAGQHVMSDGMAQMHERRQ